MRYRDLLETADPLFDGVTVDAVLARLDDDTYDLHNTWIGRAYASFADRPISAGFRAEVQAQIDKILADLQAQVGDPLVVHRGLRDAPRPDAPYGLHWTLSRRVAAEYGPHIVTAAVDPAAVDWVGTVVRRIGWPHEQEISIPPTARLRVLSVDRPDA